MTTVGTLYSGCGGADLGFLTAGCRVLWQAEADPFRRAVLAARFEDAMQYERVDGLQIQLARPVDIVYIDLPDWRVDRWWPAAWVVAEQTATWVVCEFSCTVRFEQIVRDLARAGWSFRVVLGRFTLRSVEGESIRSRAFVIAHRDAVAVDALALLSLWVDLEGAVQPVRRELSRADLAEYGYGLPVGWTCLCGLSADACACPAEARIAAATDATSPIATNWLAQLLDGRWTDGRGLDRGVTQADGALA